MRRCHPAGLETLNLRISSVGAPKKKLRHEKNIVIQGHKRQNLHTFFLGDDKKTNKHRPHKPSSDVPRGTIVQGTARPRDKWDKVANSLCNLAEKRPVCPGAGLVCPGHPPAQTFMFTHSNSVVTLYVFI